MSRKPVRIHHSVETEGPRHAAALAELKARFPDRPNLPPEDGDVFRDTLDGASHFGEAADAVVRKIRVNEALANAVAADIEALQERKARFRDNAETLREKLRNVLVEYVLEDGVRSYGRPAYTLTVPRDKRRIAAVDVSRLPPDLVIPGPPSLDLEAVMEDLRAGTLGDRYIRPGPPRADTAAIERLLDRGEEVPGVEVVFAPQSLRIGTK